MDFDIRDIKNILNMFIRYFAEVLLGQKMLENGYLDTYLFCGTKIKFFDLVHQAICRVHLAVFLLIMIRI